MSTEERTDQAEVDFDKEFDEAWEEMEKEDAGKELPEAEEPDEPEGEEEPEEKGSEPEEPKEVHPHGKDPEVLTKALQETKAHLTKVSQEKAQLERKLKDFEKGEASVEDVEKAQEEVHRAQDDLAALNEKAKALYDDYPEWQAILDPLIETNRQMAEKIDQFEARKQNEAEEEKRRVKLDNFERNIKPKVEEAHPDFIEIVQSSEYWEWAKGLTKPSLITKAMYSEDPEDIAEALTEYKRHALKDDVKEMGVAQSEKDAARLKAGQSIKPGGRSFVAPKSRKPDPDDYDAGWEDAGKIDDKEDFY